MLDAPDQICPPSQGSVEDAPRDKTGRAQTMSVGALWSALEELCASYTRAVAKPAEAFACIRAGLRAIDVEALKLQHPHVEEIIVCTLLELSRWEATWPQDPGRNLPPSVFGALALLEGDLPGLSRADLSPEAARF
jgi:hypothetical protein